MGINMDLSILSAITIVLIIIAETYLHLSEKSEKDNISNS